VVLHHPVDHQQRQTRHAAAPGADGPGNELEMVLAVGLVHVVDDPFTRFEESTRRVPAAGWLVKGRVDGGGFLVG
jgi:hypothetical protein